MSLPPGGEGGPHVFVDDVEAPVLADDDRHHLARVRRIRNGDAITICDGAGLWRRARFGDDIDIDGEVVAVARTEPLITIAMAAVKTDRTSFAVQKLTELGVDRILILHTARSVVRWEGVKGERALTRLRAITRSAAEQSRQVWIPEVAGPISVADVAAEPGVAVAERDGSVLKLSTPTMLVGPEGGWESAELNNSVPRISLGPAVLRAETAAITAGVLLTALRSGLVRGHAE